MVAERRELTQSHIGPGATIFVLNTEAVPLRAMANSVVEGISSGDGARSPRRRFASSV